MSRIFDAVRRGQGELSDLVATGWDELPEKSTLSTTETAPNFERTELPQLDPIPDVVDYVAAAASPDSRSTLSRNGSVTPEKSQRADVLRTFPLTVTKGSPLLPFDTSNTQASEQYRTIRTRILQDVRRPKSILVSSAGPGDGKTVTSINVAGALALKAEADVLLVDGDFRRSSVHRQLSVPQTPGLTDVLRGQAELEEALVRAEQFPRLCVLPAGTPVENPSDLLETHGWLDLNKELRNRFQYVVIDSPPIGAVSEYDLLQAASDCVIVIARPDHTKLSHFITVSQSVPKEKMLGVVINCVEDWFLRPTPNAYGYSSIKS